MIKSTLTKIALLFIVAVSFTACNKYEEGANISLLTAKMRVTNVWTSSAYTYETALGTSTSTTSVLTVDKDGSFTNVVTVSPLPSSTTTGTWGFNSDKTQLLLTNGNTVSTWDIVKLKNKELKLTQTGSFLGSATTSTVEYNGE
ncbi:MAG: hypothetical protein HRT58_13515 [Crocinitomicaceae bacterium]|nr:hypothetical protein [Flavobacteriales bacterium]NQZ36682.1 hypothetical protein [Crocinitomicaceae bacterium]